MAIERELIEDRMKMCRDEVNRLESEITTMQTNLHANQGAIQVLQKLLDASDFVDAVEDGEDDTVAEIPASPNGEDQTLEDPPAA